MSDMVFEDAFVAQLPADNVDACLKVAERYRAFRKTLEKNKTSVADQYDKFLQIHGFLMAFLEARGLELHLKAPTYVYGRDIDAINDVITTLEQEAKREAQKRELKRTYEHARTHYPALIPGTFSYEFLESDFKRMQELVNEMRTLTSESTQIDQQHKIRLLKRIEKLQQELHKKMSNLDLFWGFLGEAGVALGKFGEDIKPLTDRICELLTIAAKTEARANGLSAVKQTPLLKAVTEISAQSKPPIIKKGSEKGSVP